MFDPERMERACEREEEAAHLEYAAGLIDTKELNKRIRDIQRAYREAAQESAEQAYGGEMERW